MNRIATKPKLSERAMRQPALYTVYGFMAFFILIAGAEVLAMVLESIWMVIQ